MCPDIQNGPTLEKITVNDAYTKNTNLFLNGSAANETVNTLLDHERLSLLYRGLPSAIAGNLILALILTYTQRDVIESTILFAWLAAMVLILMWRTFIFYQFRHQITLTH